MQNLTPLDRWVEQFFRWDIRVYAVLASLLIAGYTLVKNPIFNVDAILYFNTAELFLNEGYQAASELYRRPLYPILIALISQLLSVSLLTASHIINAISATLLVFCFISLVKTFDQRPGIIFLAALVILLLPSFNEYRHFVIRDFGFWGFMFASLLCLVKSLQSKYQWFYILLWIVTLFISILFRIEGVLLIIPPLGIIFMHQLTLQRRLHHLGLIYFPLFAICLIALLTYSTEIEAIIAVEVKHYQNHGIQNYDSIINAIETQVLVPLSKEYANDIFIVSMLYILFAKLVSALSGPYTILLLTTTIKRFPRLSREILPIYVTTCCLFLVLFISWVIVNRFIAGRYVLTLALLLLLLVPQTIYFFYQQAITKGKKKQTAILFGFFCLYFFVDSFISFGMNKSHIKNGLAWMHGNIPNEATLLTNHPQTAYLSGKQVIWQDVLTFTGLLEGKLDKQNHGMTLKSFDCDYFVLVGEERNENDKFAKTLFDKTTIHLATFRNNRNHFFSIYHRLPKKPKPPS